MKWLRYIAVGFEIARHLLKIYKQWQHERRVEHETKKLEKLESKAKKRPSKGINSVYSSIIVIDDDSLRELESDKDDSGSSDK